MYCKNCGQSISNDSVFCSFCGTKQDLISTNLNQQQTIPQNSVPSTNTRKRKPIIIILSYIIGNSFDSHLSKDDFSYTYTITKEKIEVCITAKVDIKDFNFLIFAYRENNILHQYHERHTIDYLAQNDSVTYTILIKDIIDEFTWLEKWQLDSLHISEYNGKIRNKDAKHS